MTSSRRSPIAFAALLLGAAVAIPAAAAVRFGMATAPATLDPLLATDAASERLCRLIYGRLVDFDAHYRPAPALADWERLSPDRYRFTLRQEPRVSRRFHDGTRLTAADVKATYEAILDPERASPHRGSLAMIAGIEALDGERLEFRLNRADPDFPGRLTIGIVPAAAVAGGRMPGDRPVGSGRFRFVARPDDSRLELQRLADGETFTFHAVPNPTVRALKLARGELDLIQGDMPPEMLDWLARQPDLELRRARGDSVAYLGFNLRDPVLARPAIRAAIALAIDRAAIVRYVFAGRARVAAGLLPPDHWAAGGEALAAGRDLDRARALLRAEGHDQQRPLRLTYKTSSDPLRVRLATILQAQLREAGIEVELHTYDWGTFYADVKAGRFQMYSLSWVGLKLPDIFRYAFHSASRPPAGANRGGYADAEVDALIEQADRAADDSERQALYARIAARLAADHAFVPLWHEDVTVAVRRRVAGYTPVADGNYDALAGIRITP